MFRIIEDTAVRARKEPFEVLVDEWGTMGKKRATVGTLILLCLDVEAIRAASYLNEKILKRESPPPHPPLDGPTH